MICIYRSQNLNDRQIIWKKCLDPLQKASRVMHSPSVKDNFCSLWLISNLYKLFFRLSTGFLPLFVFSARFFCSSLLFVCLVPPPLTPCLRSFTGTQGKSVGGRVGAFGRVVRWFWVAPGRMEHTEHRVQFISLIFKKHTIYFVILSYVAGITLVPVPLARGENGSEDFSCVISNTSRCASTYLDFNYFQFENVGKFYLPK